MKKVLSFLSLIAFLGMSAPAFAAPHGPGGPGGPGGGHGPGGPRHNISAGYHHRPHVRHHGGLTIHAGYPRHSYWYGYRHGYWGDPWCNYRLGCYPPPPPGLGVYVPMGGAAFSVRF